MSKDYRFEIDVRSSLTELELRVLTTPELKRRIQIDLDVIGRKLIEQRMQIQNRTGTCDFKELCFWGEINIPAGVQPEVVHEDLQMVLKRDINTRWLRIDHLDWDEEIEGIPKEE